MKKIFDKKIAALLLVVIMLFCITAGCTGSGEKNSVDNNNDVPAAKTKGTKTKKTAPEVTEGPNRGKVVLGEGDWDSVRVHNAIAGIILEKGLGYEVELLPASTTNLFQGQRQGDVHVMMELWSDNIPAYQDGIESGDIMEISINFGDNAQGLYVPAYIIKGDSERKIEPMAPDLEFVEDLKKYPELFSDPEDPDKGLIINGPASWAATAILEEKFEYYGLQDTYNLRSAGSSSALGASIAAAYEKGAPWVGYYWEPTWVSGKYDVILLKEAPYSDELWENGYKCQFKAVKVTVAVNSDWAEENPEAVDVLSKYKTSSSLTAEALAYMQNNEATVEEAAAWFMKEKEDVWKEWVTEEQYNRIKSSL